MKEKPGNPYIEERFEIIEGIRYEMQPSPTFNHQWLVTQILSSIDRTCSSTGTVIVATMDVYFDEDNIFQPDVIYIANDNSSIIRRHRIEGAPIWLSKFYRPAQAPMTKSARSAITNGSAYRSIGS